MSLDLKSAAQRRMRRLVVILAVIVAVLIGVVVGLVTAGSESETGNAAPPADSENRGSGEPSPVPTLEDDSTGYIAPEGWVKLPEGRAEENGLPVKFPHTPEGAAAMATSSTRNAWTWDVDQIRKGIKTYVVDQYQDDHLQTAEKAAQAMRSFVGIPATGPVPEGATLSASPIGVQWKVIDSDTVMVFVLTRVTTDAGTGEQVQTRFQSAPAKVVWVNGRWKGTVLQRNNVPEAPEPADLGDQKFNEQNWKAIQEGDTR